MKLINGTNKANLQGRLAELQYRHIHKSDLQTAFWNDLCQFVDVKTGISDLEIEGPLWDTWDPSDTTEQTAENDGMS